VGGCRNYILAHLRKLQERKELTSAKKIKAEILIAESYKPASWKLSRTK
jgi:hypothetical protein